MQNKGRHFKAWQTQVPSPHTCVKDYEAGTHMASKIAIVGTKRDQPEIEREIGEPKCKKSHTAPATQGSQETKTRDPPAEQKNSGTGRSNCKAELHQPDVAATQKHQKRQKTT